MALSQTLGVIGTGALGGAMARGMLRSGAVSPDRLVLANRSGTAEGFDRWPSVRFTTDAGSLGESCDIVLLALPPAATRGLLLPLEKALILSVMAGVTRARLSEITGSARVVRGMSNPAAEVGLAYSPWVAAPGLSEADRRLAQAVYESCGLADEVPDEEQVDRFTAITGPVPGFVAYFADCMVANATANGVAPKIAARAVLQLFRASGITMAEAGQPPRIHVEQMIRYAGTTAAGLEVMQASPLEDAVAAGLDAAVARAKTIADED
jgi:pyrroline-5-carboxylate reductase